MLNEKKGVPKLRQEVKVKVDIFTSDDIKIDYTGKFQDFIARYITNPLKTLRKKDKMLETSIFSFPTMFSTISLTEITILTLSKTNPGFHVSAVEIF